MEDHGAPSLLPAQVAEILRAIPLELAPASIAFLAARLLTPSESGNTSDPGRDRYLSPDEITDQYGLDRRWVYAHAAELGAVKLGHRTMRIPESGLRRYLEERRVRRDGE